MCGRFTLTVDKDELSEHFGCPVIVPDYRPRYNVAPTQVMPVVVDAQGQNRLVLMKWGLVPRWSKDPAIGSKLINARLETASEKPAFRESFWKRRCIVPADGYYEWMNINDTKQPMRVVLKSQELFGFAGLWDEWINAAGQPVLTFTILTCEPVKSIRHIHSRMPFVLSKADESIWLRETKKMNLTEVADFLGNIKPANDLIAYPVSRLVNSPAYDNPDLIAVSTGTGD